MSALGHNVWLIQWFSFRVRRLLGRGRRPALRLLQPVHRPQTLHLAAQSAEVLLMVIAGGAGTLLGPIVGAALIVSSSRTSSSAYIDRWNMLLGAIFVDRHCSCRTVSCPALRRWCGALASRPRRRSYRRQRGAAMTPALEVTGPEQAFRRPAGHPRCLDSVMPGERRLIIGPNGAGKTTLFNLITGDLPPDAGSIRLFGQDVHGVPTQQRAHLGLARTYQIITLFRRIRWCHNVVLALLGLSTDALESVGPISPPDAALIEARARGAAAGRPRHIARPHRGGDVLRRAAAARDRDGAGAKAEAAAARRAARRASRSGERRDVQRLLARDSARRDHRHDRARHGRRRSPSPSAITVLHYGEVIVEGTRAEVVADPRTREVYLGD